MPCPTNPKKPDSRKTNVFARGKDEGNEVSRTVRPLFPPNALLSLNTRHASTLKRLDGLILASVQGILPLFPSNPKNPETHPKKKNKPKRPAWTPGFSFARQQERCGPWNDHEGFAQNLILFLCQSPTRARKAKSNNPIPSKNHRKHPEYHASPSCPAHTGTGKPSTQVGKQHTIPAPTKH